ncbi:MAG: hypothetical protein PHV97_05335 [Candidatus Omnitrophica bacterium]|nr:hypothetical protein [Candidatus Omnitrophota bacterium]
MIKEAIEKIEQMAHGQTLSLLGRLYTTKGIVPVHDPSPKVLTIETLTGLADYLEANTDKLDPDNLIIHIQNFQAVDLISSISTTWSARHHFIRVVCDTLQFPFGEFMGVESFIIRMQSQFVQDDQTAAILKIVGNVSDSVVKQFSDDGVTQQATIKAGVSRVEDVRVPNPVTLAPYRTFLEIEQPASKFVFRMRSGQDEPPKCALFESDGGNWKNEAILRIKAWLTDRISGITIIA